MGISVKKTIVKSLKIAGISIGAIVLLLFLLPILFPGKIAEKVKSFANEKLDAEMNFSKARLSFFSHFPSLTVSLYDYTLKGSAPFKNDTLITAREIAFGVNIRQLIFDKKVHIDKVFVEDAKINVLVNENGEANYNVYKSTSVNNTKADDSTDVKLRLEEITISNTNLSYSDQSLPMYIEADGVNYEGSGDLDKAIFDLNSNLVINKLDITFDSIAYFKDKKVDADLVTQINTKSLAFIFSKNKIRINKLPVEFTGKFNFLKNGYDLDFTLLAKDVDLGDCVTALPPALNEWQEQIEAKGNADILVTLKGAYIASLEKMPDFNLSLKFNNGYIKHNASPLPISNLYLKLNAALPSLETDSLQLHIDSLYFNLGKDYLSSVFHIKGLNNPVISGKIDGILDLEQLDNTIQLPKIDLKGRCRLNLSANGRLCYTPDNTGSQQEKIITSIPSFNISASMKNGYIKLAGYPQPINNINFDANFSCPDNNYLNTGFSIQNFTAGFLKNYIKGYAKLNSLNKMNIDAQIESAVNLAEISKAYPIDNTKLQGQLNLKLAAKGIYNPSAGKFPVTNAFIKLQEGSILTSYYPQPVNRINLSATATNTAGNLTSQQLKIDNASFEFENKPFSASASFINFNDIIYDVKAKGIIDVGRIYKVFSQDGVNVKGYINANVHFAGKQSDAMKGRYQKLHNKGTLQLKEITTTAQYLPLPFVINEGDFRFNDDKMYFQKFQAKYGSTTMQMNGYLQNVPAYVVTDNAVLKGEFNLNANYINTAEWMIYGSTEMNKTTPQKTGNEAISGVIIIPSNLDVAINATANKVLFNAIQLQLLKGGLHINKGKLLLKDAGFNLLGSGTEMNASYASENSKRANFDFNITTTEFDIKKAYDSVKLFRDLVSSAGKCRGLISLQYNIKGKLNENMQPIYPSLEGGGVLSVKKIKIKGFKLLNAVSEKTGKGGITNPDVSKVDIKSTIKNNVIKVQRFKIKMAGFRLRTEGETNFNGAIKLKMRLGLPPLGIIGIPMNVSGTQENPKIKLGKGDKEPVEETEYNEE